jgi:hypothetical protein
MESLNESYLLTQNKSRIAPPSNFLYNFLDLVVFPHSTQTFSLDAIFLIVIQILTGVPRGLSPVPSRSTSYAQGAQAYIISTYIKQFVADKT